MKKTKISKLLGVLLAAALLVSCLPLAGMSASAAKSEGAYFPSGNPPFIYVVTGVRPAAGDNTVKLYQNIDMQSYAEYTGDYVIPARAYDAEDMRYYSVTELGGAVGETIPGALQDAPLSSIELPTTLTTIGSKAFADCMYLTEITFPTSVRSVAFDAFTGVSLRELKLVVCEAASLSEDSAYTMTGRGNYVLLPRSITSLEVTAPLTITGQLTVPGETTMDNTGITIQPGASLTLEGELSGTGVVEVRNSAFFTLDSACPNYTGTIRLTGSSARFFNRSSQPITVQNASGRAISVQPGESLLGSQEENTNASSIPESLKPTISVNYGGTVTVQDNGKVVVISPYNGYHVEKVVINGMAMGTVTRYEFQSASQQNTVAVTFAQGGSQAGVPQPPMFVDVPTGASYAEAVAFLYNNGIFRGVSQNQFAPNVKTTRAMYVSLLKRMEIYGSDFQLSYDELTYPSDVPEESWYGQSAAWAIATGLDDGEGLFQPNRLISREEAAIYLYRFTRKRGYAAYVDSGRQYAYTDSALLSGESRQAMVWAVNSGFLTSSGGKLNPAGTVTRAEVAASLAKYLRAF